MVLSQEGIVSLTVNVNNLSLVHKGSSGIASATAPDVCKTPTGAGPVPIPYPNISRSATLTGGTTTVLADGQMAAIKGSEFATSTGDEPGSIGGVKSGTTAKAARWLSYSFDVKMDGRNACRLTDQMTCNNGNTVCLGGEFQGVVGADIKDPIVKVLCEIFCEVEKEGREAKNKKKPVKYFDYSKRAKELANGKYNAALDKLGSFHREKSLLVAVEKGALGGTNRKLYSQKALRNRLARELSERAGVKLAKGMAKKAVLKFIPVVNVISLAWDVYDVASTGYEIYKAVDEFMEKYDTFRIRPDLAKVGPDGQIEKTYDYKFGSDSLGDEQKLLYEKKSGGEAVEVIDNKTCKCK